MPCISWFLFFSLFIQQIDCTNFSCPASCSCSYVRDTINCRNIFVNQVPGDRISSAIQYDLSFNRIGRIANNAFASGRELENLFLFENMISVLEPDAFRGLYQLKFLFLHNNRLTNCWPIKRLPNLKELKLSWNMIHSISLQELWQVHSPNQADADYLQVDLQCNNLRSLSTLAVRMSRIVASSTGLKVFDLQNTTFAGSLKVVILKNNFIRILPDISNMTSLQELFLSNNLLHKVEYNSLPSLMNLELQENLLNDFPSGSFTAGLEFLDVRANSIRSLKSLKEQKAIRILELDDNLISDFKELPMLPLLHELHISRCNLHGTFMYNTTVLPRLRALRVAGNNISSFLTDTQISQENETSNTSLLDLLDIRGNQLSNVLFIKCLPRLKTLFASNNLLDKLFWNQYKGHQKLSALYLNGNNFVVLENFKNLSALLTLDLSFNLIKTVKRDALDGSCALRKLLLDNNQLTRFPVFDSQTTRLRIMLLSFNLIEHIPYDSFGRLTNLHTCNLSYNNITVFGPFLGEENNSIQSLHMSHNNIKNLANISLLAFRKIKTVDLSNNLITDISEHYWQEGMTVVNLNLSGNLLTTGTSVLHEWPIILYSRIRSVFDGTRNQIRYIPPGFFVRLEVAILSHNKITHIISEHFRGNESCILKSLFVAWNSIVNIPPNTFEHCLSLQHIDFRGNPLMRLEHSLQSLNRVVLSHTPLQSVPLENNVSSKLSMDNMTFFRNLSAFNESRQIILPMLRYQLTLSRNHLLFFPTIDAALLRLLDLSNNRISSIKNDSLLGLRSLAILNMSHNLLTVIQASLFSPWPRLKKIDLEDNRIHIINEFVFEGMSDTIVRLQGNELVSIHTESLPDTPRNVLLGSNPWHCDCAMKPFADWLLSSGPTRDVFCETPADLAGYNIVDLTNNQICPITHLLGPFETGSGGSTCDNDSISGCHQGPLSDRAVLIANPFTGINLHILAVSLCFIIFF